MKIQSDFSMQSKNCTFKKFSLSPNRQIMLGRAMRRTVLTALFAALPMTVAAEKLETKDQRALHAISVMVRLKLKPDQIEQVLVGTWQRSGQPLSCVYYRKGNQRRVAIAAVGEVKVVSTTGKEQATLCFPSEDYTGPVKLYAPGYL
jgi:sugar/nucleoside kinase (ribokinase family)